jgi:hypothetical protein
MSGFYLDSSALVKRYVDEQGSGWLRSLFDLEPRPLFVVSHLIVAELTSAFTRRLRDGVLSAIEYARLKEIFQNDCVAGYQIVPVNSAVIDEAGGLMERHPLRTLDALHLATGLLVHRFLVGRGYAGLTFVAADERLLAVARVEGLETENPNLHAQIAD